MLTTVDYLKFRTLSDPYAILEAIRPAFGSIGNCLALGDPEKGKDGWEHRRAVKLSGIKLGVIDYGGHAMREVVRFDMPGDGCEWVQDWSLMANLVNVLQKASIMRCDLALTFHKGECDHEAVLAAHDAQQFKSPRGGKQPHYRLNGGSDPRAGKTIYVGARKGSKMLRAYEKGWEMLKDLPVSIRETVTGVSVDGAGMVDPANLYRVEVEFKEADDYVVPWTMLVERDAFYAGAYPFCASLLPKVPVLVRQRLPDWGPQMTIARSVDNVRRSYGAVLRTLYDLHGRDADKVLRLLMAEKPAQNLIDAGVLTVEPI
jgi:DNA relaxase NicK